MAGNRAIYDRAMEQSREAARLKRWDEALKSAARALQEFPQEVDARTAVAISLFHTGKLDQSLRMLHELHDADPNNSFYLEYIAMAQERHGNATAALETYKVLVELHQNRRSVVKMIEVLREILRLSPILDSYREQLARLLIDTRDWTEAAAEYLNLARSYQVQGRLDEAVQYAEEALRMDEDNREAKELIVNIHDSMAHAAGITMPEPQPSEEQASHSPDFSRPLTGLRSQQFVLEKMVSEAMDKQETGDIEGAIALYEQAIREGLERADVLYSLGLLYQEREDHKAAVRVLANAGSDPEYALSVHFALGSSYKALNQLPQAAQEYEQAIGMVDLSTVGKAESEDLIQMYEEVTSIYQQIGDLARAASLYTTLANFLGSKRWGKERAQEFTQRAKELTDMNMLAKLRTLRGTGTLTGGSGTMAQQESEAFAEPEESSEQGMSEKWGKIPSILEFLHTDNLDTTTDSLRLTSESVTESSPLELLESLPVPEIPVTSEPVTPLDTSGLNEQARRWVLLSERYTEQGLYDAALDACYETMLLASDYLLIHLRMGEIFERQRMPEEALAKYQTLIDTLTVRNEQERAIDVYFRFINLAPDTISARSRLADLLHKVGRTDEAAEQLAHVAENYFRLGQTNRALEEYRRGLQWSPKNKELHAQYGLALFKLERFEAALSEFHKTADPNDPVAIAHINMTLAVIMEQPSAIWDSLAALLELLRNGQSSMSNAVQAEYRTALIVADDPLVHYILGLIQQHCEQHSSALLEFEQAHALLETEGHSLLPMVLVHQAMATSYIALEQPEQALEQLQAGQAVAKNARIDSKIKHDFARPLSQGELVLQMAEAYAAGHDLASAEKALREALRLMPSNQKIYTKLADVCFNQGKLDEAIRSLADLATYHENRQDLDQAIQILEYALKLAPGNIEVSARLARLYIRRGYPDKGVDGLVRVSELQRKEGHIRDAVSSLQQAAEIRWMQNMQEESLAIYDRIVQIAPGDIEARQWRAIMYTLVSRTDEAISEKKAIVNILAQRKDFDNAIAELHQIIGLDTEDTDAYFMLGDMLMRRGEYTQALNLYTRMSKMDHVEVERVEALIAAANRMIQGQQQIPS